MIVTERHSQIKRSASRYVVGAALMLLLSCWIWGGTASADGERAVEEQTPIERLSADMPELGDQVAGVGERAPIEEVDTRPPVNSSSIQLSGETSEPPPLDVEAAIAATALTKGQVHPESTVTDQGIEQDLAVEGGEDLHQRADSGQEASGSNLAVPGEPGEPGELEKSEEPEEIEERAGDEPADRPDLLAGISLAAHDDGPPTRFTRSSHALIRSPWIGEATTTLGSEREQWQGRTTGGGGGLTTWLSAGVSVPNITTGTDSPTGMVPLSTGARLANAVSAGSGTVHFDGHSAAGILPGSTLTVAAAAIARVAGGRFRTNTIQGAISGAGPPRSPGFSSVRPAALAGEVPVAQATRSHLTPCLASLASIRRPHPASRWQEALVRPRLVIAGEPRHRWQRLHCALSPPLGRCHPVEADP